MSLVDALQTSFKRFAHKPAVIYGEESWSYAQFAQLTDCLAGQLKSAGVRSGDRVALHLPNIPELALSYVACFKTGAIAVPVNARLKEREIDYVLRHSEAVGYIGHRDFYLEVAGLRKNLNDLRLFCLTGNGSPQPGIIDFKDLMRPLPPAVSLLSPNPAQAAVILYTSGTTARPKGVTHSHESLMQIARTMQELELNEKQVVLVASSMAHIAGFAMMLLPSLLHGATVVLPCENDPDVVLRTIEQHRCTYTFGLPTFLHALAQAQSATLRDVSCLRYVLCGGDSLSPAVQEAFEKVAGVGTYEGYGSSECVPMTFNWFGRKRVGSIGKPIGAVQIRLLDGTGNEVAPGAVGEIWIQSPSLMTGYWKDSQATAEAVRESWFRTGDLARCDAEGYYWFAGRAKQIIIRGGSNISPQEVESVLIEHPAVREAAIIGRPDAVWGEIVVAYVVLEDGQRLTEAELMLFARTRIAAYKAPEHVVFRETLPKTATGKLDRRRLRESEPTCVEPERA